MTAADVCLAAPAVDSFPEHDGTPANDAEPRLRWYQEDAIRDARAAFAAGARAVLVCLPTGSGKGLIAAWVTRLAVLRGQRVLFVVHRRELVIDLKERLEGLGITDVGVLLGGEAEELPDARVVVATIQTITARKAFPPADLIITDECHHGTAKTYRALYDAYPHAKRLGLTATPEREDGTPLGDVFDILIHPVDVARLTEEGHLVPCDVTAPAGYKKAIADHPVEAFLAHASGRRSVVFCRTVLHAEEVAAQFNQAGVSAAAVHGGTKQSVRDSVLKQWASGEILVVVNVYVLTEGFDLPAIEVCILARGCGSPGMFLQMVGRILRPSPETGKLRALLIDLMGAVHKHGLPDDKRVFSLDGKPIKLVKQEDMTPLRKCAECGAIVRGRCPACQPLAPVEMVVEKAKLISIHRRAESQIMQEEYDRLCAVRRQRNYKAGWISYRFRDRFGVWPNGYKETAAVRETVAA